MRKSTLLMALVTVLALSVAPTANAGFLRNLFRPRQQVVSVRQTATYQYQYQYQGQGRQVYRQTTPAPAIQQSYSTCAGGSCQAR